MCALVTVSQRDRAGAVASRSSRTPRLARPTPRLARPTPRFDAGECRFVSLYGHSCVPKRVTTWPNGQQLLPKTSELPPSPPNSLNVEPLHFASCPRRSSQKLETRRYARIELKTTDSNPSREFFPAQLVRQLSHNHLECDSVQWVVGLGIGHCRCRDRSADHMKRSRYVTALTLNYRPFRIRTLSP